MESWINTSCSRPVDVVVRMRCLTRGCHEMDVTGPGVFLVRHGCRSTCDDDDDVAATGAANVAAAAAALGSTAPPSPMATCGDACSSAFSSIGKASDPLMSHRRMSDSSDEIVASSD